MWHFIIKEYIWHSQIEEINRLRYGEREPHFRTLTKHAAFPAPAGAYQPENSLKPFPGFLWRWEELLAIVNWFKLQACYTPQRSRVAQTVLTFHLVLALLGEGGASPFSLAVGVGVQNPLHLHNQKLKMSLSLQCSGFWQPGTRNCGGRPDVYEKYILLIWGTILFNLTIYLTVFCDTVPQNHRGELA